MKALKYASILLGFVGSNAFGSLILQSTTPTIDISGTGLGAVNTVLTVQSPNSTSTETGCVAPSGAGFTTAGCGFTDSNVLTGNGQIGTPSASALGITTGTDIGVVLNAAEPGNDRTITPTSIVLTLYGSNNTTASFSYSGNVDLTAAAQGTGNSGFLFVLDAPQAAAASTFLTANPNARIGIGASISNATGGNETFFVANVNGTSPSPEPGPVPEPASLALIGGGLLGLGIWRKRS